MPQRVVATLHQDSRSIRRDGAGFEDLVAFCLLLNRMGRLKSVLGSAEFGEAGRAFRI